GVILSPSRLNDHALGPLLRRGLPLVLLNREVQGLTTDIVLNDNSRGTYEAVRHLTDLGHQRIGYVTAQRDVSTVRDRLDGYRQAVRDRGLTEDRSLVGRCEISIDAAREAAGKLLKCDPTAILAYNDFVAVGVLQAIADAGLRVPEDVALVGYDDIVYAAHLAVPLTTVRQQTREMAELAARILLDRLAGDESPPRREVLKPTLIIRASTSGSPLPRGEGRPRSSSHSGESET
ncbi:MAG: substrate-binding domain-containing protein, partial [Chloroflexota bacterium]